MSDQHVQHVERILAALARIPLPLRLTATNVEAVDSYNITNTANNLLQHRGWHECPPKCNHRRASDIDSQKTCRCVSAWLRDADAPWSPEAPLSHFKAGQLAGLRLLDKRLQQLGIEAPGNNDRSKRMLFPPAPPPSPVDDELLNPSVNQQLPRMAPPA